MNLILIPKYSPSIKTAVEILPAVSDEYQKIIDAGINVTPFYSSA